MRAIHAVTFLALITGIVLGTPAPLSARAVADGKVKGHITCDEPNLHSHIVAARNNDLHAFRELEVKFDLEAAKSGPVNIELVTIVDENTCYGAIAAENSIKGVTMSNSSRSYAWLGLTERHSRVWQPPTGRFRYEQSAIWMYDPASRHLTPRWLNLLKWNADLQAFWCPENNRLGITGNVSALAELGTWTVPIRQCTLKFEPL